MSRQQISPNALRVLYRLKEGGFQAFLVGGCVRDLICSASSRRTSTSPPTRCRKRSAAVPQLPADRPALPPGACVLRPRDHRGGHVPRRQRAVSGRGAEDDPDILPEVGAERGRSPRRDRSRLDARARGRGGACERRRRPGRHRVLDDAAAASCATTSTARSKKTSGAAISPATRCTTTSRTSRSGTTPAAWRTSRRGGCKLIGDPEHALSRGSGAHAARRALRGQAGLHARSGHAERRSRSCATCCAGVPAARLFDETLKLFLTGHGVRSLEVLRRARPAGRAVSGRRDVPARHPGSPVEKLLVARPGEHR